MRHALPLGPAARPARARRLGVHRRATLVRRIRSARRRTPRRSRRELDHPQRAGGRVLPRLHQRPSRTRDPRPEAGSSGGARPAARSRRGAEAVRAAVPAARVGIALNVCPCHPASDAGGQAAAVRRDGACTAGSSIPSSAAGTRPISSSGTATSCRPAPKPKSPAPASRSTSSASTTTPARSCAPVTASSPRLPIRRPAGSGPGPAGRSTRRVSRRSCCASTATTGRSSC